MIAFEFFDFEFISKLYIVLEIKYHITNWICLDNIIRLDF